MAAHERPDKIAFLGPLTSYSHQAALKLFPTGQTTLLPQKTIQDVFDAVAREHVGYGVVPLENSTYGAVVQTLDLLADVHDRYNNITIAGEIFLPIHHCLLGYLPSKHNEQNSQDVAQDHCGRSLDSDLSQIHHVYSHPQALGQCRDWLRTHFPHAQTHETDSTAAGAVRAAADTTGGSAAIASAAAASAHALSVLAHGIEDRKDNQTRFLILRPRQTSNGNHSADTESDSVPSHLNSIDVSVLNGSPVASLPFQPWKALVTFTIDHRRPGALAASLRVFQDQSLSLTSINTRPSGQDAWHYVFIVEVVAAETLAVRSATEETRLEDSIPAEKEKETSQVSAGAHVSAGVEDESLAERVRRAIEQLQHQTQASRWYGGWRQRLGG